MQYFTKSFLYYQQGNESEQSVLIMTFRHEAFIKIMKFVRNYFLSVYAILKIQTWNQIKITTKLQRLTRRRRCQTLALR